MVTAFGFAAGGGLFGSAGFGVWVAGLSAFGAELTGVSSPVPGNVVLLSVGTVLCELGWASVCEGCLGIVTTSGFCDSALVFCGFDVSFFAFFDDPPNIIRGIAMTAPISNNRAPAAAA